MRDPYDRQDRREIAAIRMAASVFIALIIVLVLWLVR
ncbi:hypothetical protein BH10PSE7_BH10PSE7_15090 [soil metagenome]